MSEQGPLAPPEAWRAVAGCFLASWMLLARRRVHLPRERVGTRIRFTDGTSARVYRETRLGSGLAQRPCTLVVAFRLRLVHGPGHALFRAESLLNTPLFVGFPGFASKLWLAHDEDGRYRGLYEWDDPQRAEHYARSLWRILVPCLCARLHQLHRAARAAPRRRPCGPRAAPGPGAGRRP
ncbi:hypothetical protein ACWD46_22275 [Streptomyces sp. NPDC002486]